MVGEEWSWRVVGISKNALASFSDNKFELPKGIQRHHHRQSFAETAKPMLEGNIIMSINEWCKKIINNEEVHLVTKEEHSAKQISEIIPIDFEEGLFRNNQMVGYRYLQEEKKHLKRLAIDHGISGS